MTSNSGACALVVFSVTEEDSLAEADELLQQLWQAGHLVANAAIMVGNKTDLVRTRTVQIDSKCIIYILQCLEVELLSRLAVPTRYSLNYFITRAECF